MTTRPRTEEPGEWFSVNQLADWLGVSPQTLYSQRYYHGEPRGVLVGRQLRFRRSEIEAWLDSLAES